MLILIATLAKPFRKLQIICVHKCSPYFITPAQHWGWSNKKKGQKRNEFRQHYQFHSVDKLTAFNSINVAEQEKKKHEQRPGSKTARKNEPKITSGTDDNGSPRAHTPHFPSVVHSSHPPHPPTNTNHTPPLIHVRMSNWASTVLGITEYVHQRASLLSHTRNWLCIQNFL